MTRRADFFFKAKRSRAEIEDEVRLARNEHLMEGIIAGCALVAYADGWVTTEEHERMLGLLRGFEPIRAFGLDEVAMTFDALTARFGNDHGEGEAAALLAVAKVKGSGQYPALLVEICCEIAAADGGFDAEERKAAIRICEVLGLDPAAFGVADAH
jgi:tellurite resistance protein TerB